MVVGVCPWGPEAISNFASVRDHVGDEGDTQKNKVMSMLKFVVDMT